MTHRAWFIVFIALIFNTTQSEARANPDPALQTALSAAAPTDKLPIYLVLQQQQATAEVLPTRQAIDRQDRRREIVNRLKAFCAIEQAALQSDLAQLQTADLAANIRPLWIANVIRLEATPAAIQALSARPEVAEVRYNPLRPVLLGGPVLNEVEGPDSRIKDSEKAGGRDPRAVVWGVDKINAPQVWSQFGARGQGVLVAILDSGTNTNHPDLQDHIWTNPGETPENGLDDDSNGYVDDMHGYDFAYNDETPQDGEGHGTHVAGTVAGDGSAGTQTGVAPEATLMIVKVLTDTGSGNEAAVWEGIQYAVENGAQIISMSLGWLHRWGPDRRRWRQVCENALNAGVTMIIAAGNEREKGDAAPDNIRTPADVPDVVTVGATNSDDFYGSFSSFGPVEWRLGGAYGDFPYPPGLIKPDVSAPGVGINSTLVNGLYSGNTWSGTSMATPHVAGTAALLLTINPDLTPAQIKLILESTSLELGSAGKDNDYGSGRIDAYQAVLMAHNGIGYVQGIITAAGQPIAARVRVRDSNLTRQANTTGAYQIGLKAGQIFVLEFSYFGYATVIRTVSLAANETQILTIDLRPAAMLTVRGQVTDRLTGAPVPNAKIEVAETALPPVLTDAAGFYQLQLPGEARYNLTASAAGHLPLQTAVFLPVDSPPPVNFALEALPKIVIWDRDQSAASDAVLLQQAIAANGQAVFITKNLTELGDLSYFKAIFICAGIYPKNGLIRTDSPEETALVEYLEHGGNLFLEGGDVWLYDLGPDNLRPYFKIAATGDGVLGGDVQTVTGEAEAFTAGMLFTYHGENNFIDRLAPYHTAFPILRNVGPGYYTAIAYADETIGYHTIGASIELGGLSNGPDPHNLKTLIGRMLEFFGINAPPLPPQSVIVRQGRGQLMLEWTGSAEPDLVGYRLYKTTNGHAFPTEPVAVIEPAGAAFFVDSQVTNEQVYFYYLTAFDTEGLISAASDTVSGMPSAFPAPARLNAGDGFDGYVPLDWQAPLTDASPRFVGSTRRAALTGLSHYILYRGETADGPFATLADSLHATSYADSTVENDVAYFYRVAAVYNDPPGQSAPSNIDEGRPSAIPPVHYLVVDFDGNQNSCPQIYTIMQNLGYNGVYTNTLKPYETITNFNTIFVCFGVHPDNYRLITDSPEEQKLTAALAAGARLYAEGGDIWFWDYKQANAAQNFVPYFQINGLKDGAPYTDNLPKAILGVTHTILDGLNFSYNGDDAYLDHIEAMNGGINIFTNDDQSYYKAVLYQDRPLRYKTIGAAFEFGGLINGAHTKTELLQKYLAFFEDRAELPKYPAAPTGIKAAGDDGFVDLSWMLPVTNTDGTPLTNLAGVKIYKRLDGGSYSPQPLAILGAVTNYRDERVVNDRLYYYRLTAFNTAGFEGPPAPEIPAATQKFIAPQNLAATSGQNAVISLSWEFPSEGGKAPENPAPFASKTLRVWPGTELDEYVLPSGLRTDSVTTAFAHFRIYRATQRGGPYLRLADQINQTAYQDRTIRNGPTYYYVVTTVYNDPAYETEASNEVAAQGNTPPNVQLITPNGGETYTTGLIPIRWVAGDNDFPYGDSLTTTLFYSADNGQSWREVPFGPLKASSSVSRSQSPIGNAAVAETLFPDIFSQTNKMRNRVSPASTFPNRIWERDLHTNPVNESTLAIDEKSAAATADSLLFEWDVRTLPDGSAYRLKVIMTDRWSIQQNDESDAEFRIDNLHPPRFMAQNTLIFDEDTIAQINLTDLVADADHPLSSLRWEFQSDQPIRAFLEDQALRLQPAADWSGQAVVQLRVTDPDHLSAQMHLMVTVNPVNDPPQLILQEPDTVADWADSVFQICWTAEDVDNNAVVSLFRSLSPTDANGELLTDGLSEDNGPDCWTWETAVMPENVYFIYGIIEDFAGKTMTRRSAPVVVMHRPPGDLDNDKKISLLDVKILSEIILEQRAFTLLTAHIADMDHDGRVTITDLVALVAELAR